MMTILLRTAACIEFNSATMRATNPQIVLFSPQIVLFPPPKALKRAQNSPKKSSKQP